MGPRRRGAMARAGWPSCCWARRRAAGVPRRRVQRRVPRRPAAHRRAAAAAARLPRPPAVGTIAPWPLPPALIIRQTPGVHDEVRGLLRALRR
jgi:hypothetical protein